MELEKNWERSNYLLLFDHRTQLVSGQVHAVEVGQACLALSLFNDQTEFSECVLIAVQVAERCFEDTTLKTIRGNLYSHSERK